MFKTIIRRDNYLCPLMTFFKKNIFGFFAILIGIYLLHNSITNIIEIQNFDEFYNVGEYIAVERSIAPNLTSGIIKTSLVFLFFLVIPVMLAIIHKKRKADHIILYAVLALVIANFLVFSYLLTLIYNLTNSI